MDPDTKNVPGATVTSGVTVATATAAAVSEAAAAPGNSLVRKTPGDTVAAKIQALHTAHFAGTALGSHTDLWNLVDAFKTDVIALVAEAYDGVEAKL